MKRWFVIKAKYDSYDSSEEWDFECECHLDRRTYEGFISYLQSKYNRVTIYGGLGD